MYLRLDLVIPRWANSRYIDACVATVALSPQNIHCDSFAYDWVDPNSLEFLDSHNFEEDNRQWKQFEEWYLDRAPLS